MLSYEFFEGITRGKPKAEGLKHVHQVIVEGLKSGKINASRDVPSLEQLGISLGALDRVNPMASWRKIAHDVKQFDTEHVAMEHIEDHIFNESNLAVMSHAFATITGELISSKILEAYNAVPSVADQLMQTMTGQRVRNQKIAGVSHIGGGFADIAEGHPYPETDFGEKYITTAEFKNGSHLNITEELLHFDQTGVIYLRATDLGNRLRESLERTKIRGIIDTQDVRQGAVDYVYRPRGVGETLYATDGSNLNYIGSGGVAGFNSASPLVDWTDLDLVRKYRATKVVDDRIDGTPRPISGINSGLTLLVPDSLLSTSNNIVYPMQTANLPSSSGGIETRYGNPMSGFVTNVLSSVYLDEVNADDYYIGDFKRQYLWTEIWPVQTFVQGRDSESAFTNDVILRVKARYYGGLSALDSIYVTKVDGA